MEQKTLDDLNKLRTRVLAGEKFSPEEYREIMRAYREVRKLTVTKAAPAIESKAIASAGKSAPSLTDILSNIMKGTK